MQYKIQCLDLFKIIAIVKYIVYIVYKIIHVSLYTILYFMSIDIR